MTDRFLIFLDWISAQDVSNESLILNKLQAKNTHELI